MLDEYADVLGELPELVAEITTACRICHPLTELKIIRHEPDNRFLECAFAADADYLVTKTRIGTTDPSLLVDCSISFASETLGLGGFKER